MPGGNTVNVLEFITHLHMEVKKKTMEEAGDKPSLEYYWMPSPAAKLTFRASLSLKTQ